MNDRLDEMQPAKSQVDSGPLIRFRFGIRSILWSIAIIGMTISLFLPAMRSAPEAARRAQCVNNMKQIALALHHYQEMYGTLPPAYVAADDGTPLHSWRVLILPFLDRNDIYDQYRFDEPWDGPNNRKLAERNPMVYRCPTIERSRSSLWRNSADQNASTHYLVLTGDQTPFPGPRATKIEDIGDGTSNTILVVEVDRENVVPWMAPRDIDPASFIRILSEENKDRTQHPGGMNITFADGSVKFIKASVNRNTLEALMTVNGSEKIAADAY